MICPGCGMESFGVRCPHCGARYVDRKNDVDAILAKWDRDWETRCVIESMNPRKKNVIGVKDAEKKEAD